MKRKLHNPYAYWLLVPGMLVYVSIFVLPTLIGFVLSFSNWSYKQATFFQLNNLLKNYETIIRTPELSRALTNTLVYTLVTTAFKVILGTVLAVFLNQKLKLGKYLRTIYFMPAVVNMASIGILFASMMHPSRGFINNSMSALGLGFLRQDWLTNARIAMLSLSSIEIWKWTGFTMVIILAGLQTVPHEYHEAAMMDGAGGARKFFTITFPLIMPAFNNALILNLLGGLKVFDLIFVVTEGGPGTATEVVNSMIYKLYSKGYLGEASAGNVLLTLAVAILSIGTFLQLKKNEVEL